TNYTYEWEVGQYGQCINGVKTRTVTCVQYPGGVEVQDYLCIQNVGPKPATTTTQGCGTTGGNDLEVATLGATNVGPTFATLRGRVTDGSTSYVFFVYNQEYQSL